MKSLSALLVTAILCGLLASPVLSQEDGAQEDGAQEDGAPANENAQEDPTHEDLRALRDRMFGAYEKRDVDALLHECTDNVVITWQNGERNVGHEEFREFYDKMMKGDSRIVSTVSSQFSVEDLSFLYGDSTAVARGKVVDDFVLTSGSEFSLNSLWTATLVKQEEKWMVASFHLSASIFENPILATAKGSLKTVGIVAGVVGLLVGWLVAKLRRKKAPV